MLLVDKARCLWVHEQVGALTETQTLPYEQVLWAAVRDVTPLVLGHELHVHTSKVKMANGAPTEYKPRKMPTSSAHRAQQGPQATEKPATKFCPFCWTAPYPPRHPRFSACDTRLRWEAPLCGRDITYLQAFRVESVASIFSMGGIMPWSSTCMHSA